MPTLEFKGKQSIYSHHHSVPFRELLVDSQKSLPANGNKPSLDDNLIIHGDNLHALKALMPHYAGKIKCIYIDPPYNTGNEGWCYNDNVNSPLMKEWLKKNANPVDKEDMERHDKWLCMMYPRLKLLHELLADDGVIFVSIDDNEVHNLRGVMDEIFDNENFITTFVVQKRSSPDNDEKLVTAVHDYLVCYAKSKNLCVFGRMSRTLEADARYSNPDNDSRGVWTSSDLTRREYREHDFYPIHLPSGRQVAPAAGRSWSVPKETFQRLLEENRVWFGRDGNAMPRMKRFLTDVSDGIVPTTWLAASIVGDNQQAKRNLRHILHDQNDLFSTPKPTTLIMRILEIAADKDSIILDSFAGSGTTAHAVLALNKEDGGNRKFILVEMEDYADSITAERVRRVIKGVPNAKDEKLKQGLDGSFTFCELGKEISIEKIITGEALPDYGALAQYVFYTATGKSLDGEAKEQPDYFVGETALYEVYLIYTPDVAFLRGNESALNDIKLKAIADRNSRKEKLVFATAKYMGQKELSAQNITFCQLPYSIHKVVGA